MGNHDPKTVTEHPSEAMVAFIEGILSPEDRMAFEAHIGECEKCAGELNETKRILAAIGESADEILCPESWTLHEIAASGEAVPEDLVRHLQVCNSCRQELQNYLHTCEEPVSKPIPSVVLSAFEENFAAQKPASVITGQSLWERFRQYFLSNLAVSGLATAAAAAVILLFVIGLPHRELPSRIALSETAWPESVLMGVPKSDVEKPRVAIVLILGGGLQETIDQTTVDGLYQALSPGKDLTERFEFIQPADIAALAKDGRPGSEALIEKVFKDLEASKIVVLSIAPASQGYKLTGELKLSGKKEDSTVLKEKGVAIDMLAQRLTEMSRELLMRYSDNR
jgi:hypothetical protein